MTPQQRKAMELALEALEKLTDAAEGFSISGVYFNEELQNRKCLDDAYDAMGFAQEALAEQPAQQEPAFYLHEDDRLMTPDLAKFVGLDLNELQPLYTTPPAQRKPLTDEQISDQQCRRLLYGFMLDFNAVGFEQAGRNLHRAMKEAAHGIKGD